MSRKKEEPGPSKNDVRLLLKDLWPERFRGPLHREADNIQTEIDALTKKLLDVPEMRKLEKKLDAASRKREETYEKDLKRVTALKRLFLAEGLTARVLVGISAMVKEVNER